MKRAKHKPVKPAEIKPAEVEVVAPVEAPKPVQHERYEHPERPV